MKRIIFAALLTTFMGACSVGHDAANQDSVLLQQNKDTNDRYGGLTGTYSGKMVNTDHGDEQVELIIWITTVQTPNPDGSSGSKDVVEALFRRNDPVVADYSMDVNGYQPESGTFSLTNQVAGTDVNTIRASYRNGHITGDVLNSGRGVIGQLQIDFASKDTTAKDDAQQRLYRQYQSISGVYKGQLAGFKNGISVTLSAALSGNTARLDGLYKDLDVPTGDLDLALAVAYRPDRSPATITMNGRGEGRRALDFDGTLVNGVMEVDVTSPLIGGYLGHSTLTRVDEFPDYQKAAGTYRGTWTNGGKKVSASMKLEAVKFNNVPKLQATLTLGGTAYSLQTNWEVDSGTFMARGPGPGGNIMILDGKLAKGVLTLEVDLNTGNDGTMILKR